MNARQKGLSFVREVRKILEGIGHLVEGPGYGVAFFGGQMRPIHRDYFEIYDLISFFEGHFFGHQVTTLNNKAAKIQTITKKALPCWIWCRVNNGKVFYRVFDVRTSGWIQEAEIRWKV